MKPESIRAILLSECRSFNKNGFDTDIDRYVTLIDEKKYRQAAYLYEKHLIPRYPDEYKRIRIIRYYRKKDSRFSELYAGAVREIFERIVFSVKMLISHISSLFEGNNSDPYRLLKKIETALKVIPHGREEGIAFIEKMEGYSILLDYMPQQTGRAADILKRYFDNTLFVKVEAPPESKSVREEKKGAARKSAAEGKEKKKVTIDLDKVEFSGSDIAMICIDERIKGRSYQVLAYCRLYWRKIFNQDFEKKVFLYSKKYNTLHYRIFQIIKNFRIKKRGDDVILLEIYSLLSNGYRYSLKEDLFMQSVWRKIKPVDQTAKAAAPGRVSGTGGRGAADGRTGSGEAAGTVKTAKTGPAAPGSTRKKGSEAETRTAKAAAGKAGARPGAGKKDAAGKGSRAGKRPVYSPGRSDTLIIPLREKLERLCQGELFNAHEEFSRLLPGHIERFLVRHREKGVSHDPYVLKGALYVISSFIHETMDTVSPDWKESLARTEVTNMGFNVPEIDTIIARCLEEIRLRKAVA